MKILSLFSGIGGFEYGIQQSNKSEQLKVVAFSEIDKYAKSIYKKHYPNHIDLGDVTKIRTEDLPTFDFLVGGFPCQAFSVAGKRRGFSDTRGTLFFEIARILKDKKPKYFLLENVKGLLSHDKGRTFQTILGTLSKLGYDVQWEIFNSKRHGVPQNRERIYIKGFLRTRCGQEILSLRETSSTPNARQRKTTKNIETVPTDDGNITFTQVDENQKATTTTEGNFYAVTTRFRGLDFQKKQDNYIVQENTNKIIRLNKKPQNGRDHEENRLYSSRGISPTLNCHDNVKIMTNDENHDNKKTIFLRNNTQKGYQEAREGDGFVNGQYNCRGRVQKQSAPTLNTGDGSGVGVIDIVGNVYHNGGQNGNVFNADGIVGTLGLSHGGKGGGYGTYDGYVIRKLTPIETERLQGFPDNWTKHGVDGEIISNTQRYKCCGNAVTTSVVRDIIDTWNMKFD